MCGCYCARHGHTVRPVSDSAEGCREEKIKRQQDYLLCCPRTYFLSLDSLTHTIITHHKSMKRRQKHTGTRTPPGLAVLSLNFENPLFSPIITFQLNPPPKHRHLTQ